MRYVIKGNSIIHDLVCPCQKLFSFPHYTGGLIVILTFRVNRFAKDSDYAKLLAWVFVLF